MQKYEHTPSNGDTRLRLLERTGVGAKTRQFLHTKHKRIKLHFIEFNVIIS
jgi:hypothetical protein